MKKQILVLSSVLLTAIFASLSCSKSSDTSTTCDTAGVTYTNNVKPIMSASCTSSGCHSTSSHASGIILDTYDGVKAAAQSGGLVSSIQSGSMPRGASKLESCVITKIKAWVDAGALNN